MAGASLTFDDGSGPTTLQPYPDAGADAGHRFRNWIPFPESARATDNALADGRLYTFDFRVGYGASFELPGLPRAVAGDVIRLMHHLEGGGFVDLDTADANAATYTDCQLAPGTKPELVATRDDPNDPRYTLRLSLISMDSTPAPLLCEYAG